MTTSKAILFVQDGCGPCRMVKDQLSSVLTKDPGYGRHISVTKKNPVLAQEYKIKMFPTLLIIDSDGEEIGRLVGGRNIAVDLRGVLFALYSINE